MSKLNDILDAIVDREQDAVVGLGQDYPLTVAGNPPTVVKRKMPKVEEAVDDLFQVTVSGAERTDQIRRLSFGSRYQVVYEVEITLVIPAVDALTNLDGVTDWREEVRARYMRPGALSSLGVKKIDIDTGVLFDGTLLNKNYDYDQVILRLTTYENRNS